MITLKRLFAVLLSISILSCAASCSKSHPADEISAFESSLALISEKMNVTRDEAISILEVLSSLGLDDRIDEIYVAEDEDGKVFYKVWFGLHLLSVYIDNNAVSEVYKHGVMLYPEKEDPKSDDNKHEDNSANDDQNKNEELSDLNATLVSLTTPVKAGKSATIEITAEPNTEYSITVRYSSGPSSAKGLEPKLSDENGSVSWTWKVSANVKPGEYTIEIKSGNAVYETTFVVEPADSE